MLNYCVERFTAGDVGAWQTNGDSADAGAHGRCGGDVGRHSQDDTCAAHRETRGDRSTAAGRRGTGESSERRQAMAPSFARPTLDEPTVKGLQALRQGIPQRGLLVRLLPEGRSPPLLRDKRIA